MSSSCYNNEVLEEEAALLEGTEEFYVVESKWKEVAARDEERQQPSKKARGKYYRGDSVMGRNKDCLLGELVDYDQDSVKPGGW